MEISAIETTSRRVNVSVRLESVFDELRAKLTKSFKVVPQAYVNTSGDWETWEDTHGSGIYRTVRKATAREIKLMNAFNMLKNNIKE